MLTDRLSTSTPGRLARMAQSSMSWPHRFRLRTSSSACERRAGGFCGVGWEGGSSCGMEPDDSPVLLRDGGSRLEQDGARAAKELPIRTEAMHAVSFAHTCTRALPRIRAAVMATIELQSFRLTEAKPAPVKNSGASNSGRLPVWLQLGWRAPVCFDLSNIPVLRGPI